jgi:sensor histidine kinase YesM
MEATAPTFTETPAFAVPEARRFSQLLRRRFDCLGMSEPQVRVGGILIVALLISVLREHTAWHSLLFSLFCTAISWEGNRQLFFFLRRRYPNYESTAFRLVLQVWGSLAYMLMMNAVFAVTRNLLPFPRLPFREGYSNCLVYSLTATLLVMTIYESAYFFGEWKRYYLRAAQLEKDRAVSQLAALKQQVDPHFLFNTLNALAALVGDNAPAQEFIDELASVYRYVLTRRDLPTVTVAEEMAFVESYMYLNRIRHQDAVRVVSHLPAEVLQRHVPPLSIQMLVENALKHNAASVPRPLCIELRAEADYLSVTNNVQPKTTLARGPGLGLRNLQEQFQLLAGREVLVQPGVGQFAVQLPLLAAHARHSH